MKKFLVIVLIVLVVLFFARNFLIKTGMSIGSKVATGLYLSVDKVDLDLFKSSFDIEGLKLYNPEGYLDPVMVSVPKVLVDCNIGALLQKKVHIESFVLMLDEVYVIKNEAGQLNIDTFKKEKEAAKPAKKVEKKPGKKGEPMAMQLDYVHFKIGKVIYKDYSKGTGTPDVKDYNVNIDQEYEDIQDPKKLISGLISITLAKTSLGNLADIDMDQFSDAANELQGNATKMMDDLAAQASGTSDAYTAQMQEQTASAVEEMKEKVKSLTSLSDKLKLGSN
ncbi:MAG: AsmA family protein [Candidatus Omnitrophica bacterium]|nr:AsmA family protein [Candidatus Omnitrophota bacterium]